MGGLMNALETTRTYELHFFTPSSIGAFGDSTPKKDTQKYNSTTYYNVWCEQSCW